MFIASKFAAVLGSIALIASAGAASSQNFVSNGRTSEVRHGDLNLSKAADQQALRGRIARAVGRVCNAQDMGEQQACKRMATAQAQVPVNAAIARAETGERYADARGQKVPGVVGN
ncbi:UrcA family protein [Sphingobium sp. KCTC 72723]|uniref:UrcA family protein n=1 Tax=Sphingobium sp. KCTC 72723 TaxID=2733867 RepID=UPI00165E0270|nr:UrcA family protein [Sphingobium sp. KCTC 72723]